MEISRSTVGISTTPPGTPRTKQAAEAVEELAEAAVRTAVDEISRRHGAALALRGTKGRQHTEQDLRYHVQFLAGALATGAPVFFSDYVCWLAQTLEARGIPARMVDESLEILSEFFAARIDPELSKSVVGMIERGRSALARTGESAEPIHGAYRPAALPQVEAFIASLIAGDIGGARAASEAARQQVSRYADLATGLFQPALYDIGTMWQRNEVTVAQEHLATALAQTLLTQHYLEEEPAPAQAGRSALFAAIEGNQHALGLRIVSDTFALAGWSVQFLGADTPTEALFAQVDLLKPDVLGLSVSMVQQLPALRRAVQMTKAELGTRCPVILIGGLPTNQFDRTWRWVGADAWSPDAVRAVEEVA